MKNPKVVYGLVIAAVVLAAVVVWSLYSPANNANFPEGTAWLCTNPKCGNTFTLTMRQLGEHNKKNFGQPVQCAKCTAPAVRAQQCRHCQKWHPRPHEGYKCPHCGKDNPPIITRAMPTRPHAHGDGRLPHRPQSKADPAGRV